MAVQYKAYEFRVYHCVSQFRQLLEEARDSSSYPAWKEKASKMLEDLEKRKFRVAVVGEFNRGKTSFVNALLGKKILPEDYVPTTAALNRITYSDTPDSYLVFKDGRRKTVALSDLAGYVTKLTEESARAASEIQEAVVEYPSLLCRDGVDLIDTPGLNDDDGMNAVTLSKLEEIDLALAAIDPSMPFSMTECRFTLRLLENPKVSQIVFIATKMDMIRERERERAVAKLGIRIKEHVEEELRKCHGENSAIWQKYHEIFDELKLFPVSSLDAMDALSCGDMEAYRKSGFWELNSRLPDIIMASQNQSAVLAPIRGLKEQLEEIRQWNRKKGREQEERKKHNLEEILQAFHKTGSKGISHAFAQARQNIGKIYMLPERVASSCTDAFEQALKRRGSLNGEECRNLFATVIRELYQNLNWVFVEKERSYLSQYQTGTLMMQGRWNHEQLDRILRPYPGIQKEMDGELAELSRCFSFCDLTSRREVFFWKESPIPEASMMGNHADIMQHVKSALTLSIADYQERRVRELGQMAEKSQERLDQQFEACKKKLLSAISAEYMKPLCGQEADKRKKTETEILCLEQEVSKLEEDFLAEIYDRRK